MVDHGPQWFSLVHALWMPQDHGLFYCSKISLLLGWFWGWPWVIGAYHCFTFLLALVRFITTMLPLCSTGACPHLPRRSKNITEDEGAEYLYIHMILSRYALLLIVMSMYMKTKQRWWQLMFSSAVKYIIMTAAPVSYTHLTLPTNREV